MSNYMTKAATYARLIKLASAARLIRRQRALQKYAQAVQMQKLAADAAPPALKGPGGLSNNALAMLIGGGLGAAAGGGIGYGLGKKDKKLLSALIGAGAGAGLGVGGGALYHHLARDKGQPISPNDPLVGGTLAGATATRPGDYTQELNIKPGPAVTLAGAPNIVPDGTYTAWPGFGGGTVSLYETGMPDLSGMTPIGGTGISGSPVSSGSLYVAPSMAPPPLDID